VIDLSTRTIPANNTTQHNTTQHNTTQHNTTQHNTTQHNTCHVPHITRYTSRLDTLPPIDREEVRLWGGQAVGYEVLADTTDSIIYPNDAQLDCCKNVKIYIKIYMKETLT
jgi:hypothetical protein